MLSGEKHQHHGSKGTNVNILFRYTVFPSSCNILSMQMQPEEEHGKFVKITFTNIVCTCIELHQIFKQGYFDGFTFILVEVELTVNENWNFL